MTPSPAGTSIAVSTATRHMGLGRPRPNARCSILMYMGSLPARGSAVSGRPAVTGPPRPGAVAARASWEVPGRTSCPVPVMVASWYLQTSFANYHRRLGTVIANKMTGGRMTAGRSADQAIWLRPEHAAVGRPAQRSRAEITAAAVAVADAGGLDAVSM